MTQVVFHPTPIFASCCYSYQAVEGMRQGLSVREAVRQTVVRMNETFGHVPNVDGAVIGANVDGDYGESL